MSINGSKEELIFPTERHPALRAMSQERILLAKNFKVVNVNLSIKLKQMGPKRSEKIFPVLK